MVCKHAFLNTLLLLDSPFMLNLMKMQLKGEVGGHALNSHGNYIVDHGIVFLNYVGTLNGTDQPALPLLCYSVSGKWKV